MTNPEAERAKLVAEVRAGLGPRQHGFDRAAHASLDRLVALEAPPPAPTIAGREAVAQFLRDRDEALGPVGEHHTEAERLVSADTILALSRPPLDGWRPISEAPPEDDLFLVCGRHANGQPWWNFARSVGGEVYCDAGDFVEPTHFMPLPAPPAGVG